MTTAEPRLAAAWPPAASSPGLSNLHRAPAADLGALQRAAPPAASAERTSPQPRDWPYGRRRAARRAPTPASSKTRANSSCVVVEGYVARPKMRADRRHRGRPAGKTEGRALPVALALVRPDDEPPALGTAPWNSARPAPPPRTGTSPARSPSTGPAVALDLAGDDGADASSREERSDVIAQLRLPTNSWLLLACRQRADRRRAPVVKTPLPSKF